MRVAVGCDHRGRPILLAAAEHLRHSGHEVTLVGPECNGPCDYPDSAREVCEAVRRGDAERGMLACGTGIGMCIAANKFPGIRAALALDELSAQLSRSHNDANVLCLSGDLIGLTLVRRIVDTWIETQFEGGRHQRRIDKIEAFERLMGPGSSA